MSQFDPYTTETDLIHHFHLGDQEAFTQVYNSFYERLYWYALKFIKQEQEVEDMLSEAYLSTWNNRQQFDNLEAIAAYLHVAVRNQCFTLLRHRQMKQSHQEAIFNLLAEQQPGDFTIELIQADLMRKIFEQVELLPPKMKEIFLYSYKEGLKPAEIARELGLNVQTVKNRKVNALKLLKTALPQHPHLLVILACLESAEKNIH